MVTVYTMLARSDSIDENDRFHWLFELWVFIDLLVVIPTRIRCSSQRRGAVVGGPAFVDQTTSGKLSIATVSSNIYKYRSVVSEKSCLKWSWAGTNTP
jgi:hypothetical protein